MAPSNSMWLRQRPMLVVPLLMMAFLRSVDANAMHTECSTGGAPDVAGVIKIGERTLAQCCQCIPFQQCCDKLEDEKLPFLGLVNERTPAGIATIDIIQPGRNNQCGEKLEICCRCVKKSNEPMDIDDTDRPTGCGKRNTEGVSFKVIGFDKGQTQQGEFPWMVAVMAKNETLIGGGSLIHPRMVLTAGHKVHRKTADSLMARIGDWDISEQRESIAPQDIDIKKIMYHEQFNRSLHHYNVAILILKTRAKLGATVAPVCLPHPEQKFDGKNCFVTGWGKDKFGDAGKYQTIMKMVSVPLVDHSTCQAKLQKAKNKYDEVVLDSTFVLHDSLTCAGGGKEDACTGDGGAPLVCQSVNDPQQFIQVGVVAWGIGCGIEGNPGVYGSLQVQMDWITATKNNIEYL